MENATVLRSEPTTIVLPLRYIFGDCELSTETREFRRAGELVHAEPQVLAVLEHLIAHRERVVTKIELLDEIWGSRFVSESALTTRIKTIRQICADTGRDQRVIRTVHGRGYRFVAALTSRTAGAAAIRAASSSGGLVGRDAEVELIETALREAAGGRRATVFVTGPAGIGKSALLAEALELVDDGWHVLRGQAVPARGPVEPYFALLDALSRAGRAGNEHVAAALDRVAPTWLAQLPSLMQPGDAERLERRLLGSTAARMLREGAEAIEELARTKPVVLVLEDLHWADASTLDVVDLLAQRSEAMPLMVLASARSEASAAADLIAAASATGRARHVDLAGLPVDAVGPLAVRSFDGAAIAPELLEIVGRRGGGVPLFVLELLRGWRHRGDVVLDAQGTLRPAVPTDQLESTVPDTVRQLLERDLAHLDPRTVALLEAAALVGRSFDAASVAAALGEPVAEVDRLLSSTARQLHHIDAIGGSRWPAGVMSTQFEFTHDLYRQVLSDRLPVHQRALVHANVGRALEAGYAERRPEIAGRLAVHFVEAGDHGPAVEYLRQVGEQASARSAFGPAASALLDALHHLGQLPAGAERDRAELRVRLALGPVLVATRGWYGAEVTENYERALAIATAAGAGPEAAIARYGLATVTELRGQYDRTEALLEPLLTGSVVETESQELMACSTFHQGNFAESLQHATTVLDAWDGRAESRLMASVAEHPASACNSWASLAAWGLGRFDESERFADRAIAIGEENLYALSTAKVQRAFLHQLRREPDACREWALAAIRLAEAQGYPLRALQAQMLLGWAEAVAGEPGGAARIAAALDGFRSTGALLSEPYFVGLLAEAELVEGRAERAIDLLEEALASMTRGSRTFFAGPELHRLMARAVATLDPDRPSVRAHLAASLAGARELASPVLEERALAEAAALQLAGRVSAAAQDHDGPHE